MKKTILITGSTDGIGFETAKILANEGHIVLVHGRDELKVENKVKELQLLSNNKEIEGFVADLSSLQETQNLATKIKQKYTQLDVLINNAGIYKTNKVVTKDELDIRFVVNTIAPYLLTKELLAILSSNSRVVNLSSAAQAPVDLSAMQKLKPMSDSEAYAQSKLALTMWTSVLAEELKNKNIVVVSVNPKSFLGSKMVKDAYGVAGFDLSIGAEILYKASFSNEFANASGKYFDNDIGSFTQPHPFAQNKQRCDEVVQTIKNILSRILKNN